MVVSLTVFFAGRVEEHGSAIETIYGTIRMSIFRRSLPLCCVATFSLFTLSESFAQSPMNVGGGTYQLYNATQEFEVESFDGQDYVQPSYDGQSMEGFGVVPIDQFGTGMPVEMPLPQSWENGQQVYGQEIEYGQPIEYGAPIEGQATGEFSEGLPPDAQVIGETPVGEQVELKEQIVSEEPVEGMILGEIVDGKLVPNTNLGGSTFEGPMYMQETIISEEPIEGLTGGDVVDGTSIPGTFEGNIGNGINEEANDSAGDTIEQLAIVEDSVGIDEVAPAEDPQDLRYNEEVNNDRDSDAAVSDTDMAVAAAGEDNSEPGAISVVDIADDASSSADENASSEDQTDAKLKALQAEVADAKKKLAEKQAQIKELNAEKLSSEKKAAAAKAEKQKEKRRKNAERKAAERKAAERKAAEQKSS